MAWRLYGGWVRRGEGGGGWKEEKRYGIAAYGLFRRRPIYATRRRIVSIKDLRTMIERMMITTLAIFYPSFLPSFFLTFLPPFLPTLFFLTFLSSLLPPYLLSFLPYYTSFHSFILPSFLPKSLICLSICFSSQAPSLYYEVTIEPLYADDVAYSITNNLDKLCTKSVNFLAKFLLIYMFRMVGMEI